MNGGESLVSQGKALLEDFFTPSGYLARRLDKYEYRPQQLTFAAAVHRFLLDPVKSTMAAEAPPGVGKTFAVLIPAIMEAEDRNILFLTASIALQEQLIDKDLPKLRSILGKAGKSFSYGLLKGRGNYACLRRAAALSNMFFHSSDETPLDLSRWLGETESGDFSELSLPSGHPLFLQAAASAGNCIGAGCPFRSRCFVIQSFRNAQDWQVVVANYHLFFSHILSGKGSFPVRYDWLVCDEAHRIPDAARSAATVEAGSEHGRALLRPRALSGFEPLFSRHDVNVTLFRERAAESREYLDALFALAELRYRQGEGITACDEELLHKGEELAGAFDKLLSPVRALEDRFMSGGFEHDSDLGEAASVVNWIDDLNEFRRSALWCLKVGSFPNWGYWRGSGAKGAGTLMSAPVVCSEIIRNALSSEAPDKNVMVSATLALDGDFSFWSRETGVRPEEKLVVESPFDFENQMEILVADVGVPVAAQGYDERVGRIVSKLCDDNGGRSLVLLSSTRLLRSVAGHMRGRERAYEVLAQGDMPQRELLRRFRETETSALLGCVSFREGVDVPGDGLTQVIIDRIPFPHPNDPLIQARNALEGQKAFVKTTLPNAKMFLRQAVGRLIRGASDRGRVVLLDGRILDRGDWKVLETLPRCRLRRLNIKI
ncbi:MAG: ATP-dependent DNA helicase [Synergistaceae bacterium]|nr:ATP-dependent DNA helicase [Synergistaceae bacterium]